MFIIHMKHENAKRETALELCLQISFLICILFTCSFDFSPSLCPGSAIQSSGPVPKAGNICLGSTTSFFETLVTTIRNGTFLGKSCKLRTRRILFDTLPVCIRSFVIKPHFDVMTTTCEIPSAGRAMRLLNQIVPCFFRLLIWAIRNHIVVMLASDHLPSMASSAECSGNIFCSTRNIPQMPFLIYIVQIQTCTVRFWTTANQICTCSYLISSMSRITLWKRITSFISVLDLRDLTRLMQYFHERIH